MKILKWLFLSILVLGLGGCRYFTVDYFKPMGLQYDAMVSSSYKSTFLKRSSSADVISFLESTGRDIVSQGDGAVGSYGETDQGREYWMNLVAFDDLTMSAYSKYFLLVDERPSVISWNPKKAFYLETEMVVAGEVLDAPYADENSLLIAVVKYAGDKASEDISRVSESDKQIGICGMMIRQALGGILYSLEQSPVLAGELSKEDGMEFDHMNLGKGRVYMDIIGDVARLKVRIGSPHYSFEDEDTANEKAEALGQE